MKINSFILYIGLLLAITGCKTSSKSTLTEVRTVHDTFVQKQEAVYVPVYLPGDTTFIEVPIGCDTSFMVKPFVAKSNSHRANVKVTVAGGKLSVIATCNEWIDSVLTLNTTIAQLRDVNYTHSASLHEVKEVTRIPSLYKWALSILIIQIIILILYIIFKIVKPFITWKL